MIVLHVISGLNRGGAELALLNYLRVSSKDRSVTHKVICLNPSTSLSLQIRDLGIQVRHYNLKDNFLNIWTLYRGFKSINPDVVHTWMYHADLIGGLIAKVQGVKNILWSIHNSSPIDLPRFKSTRLVVFILAKLSGFIPSVILSPSKKASESHINYGYSPKKFIEVPLGIDTKKYEYRLSSKSAFCASNKISESVTIICMVARFHEQKRFPLFFEMARILLNDSPNYYFVLAGNSVTENNSELKKLIVSNDLLEHCLLLGEIQDTQKIFTSIDIMVSTSAGESFSLVLLESLMSSVPSIASESADPQGFIGKNGVRVKKDADAKCFANAVKTIQAEGLTPGSTIGIKNSQKLCDRYSILTMANTYLDIYRSL